MTETDYRVEFSAGAVRSLEQLPEKIATAVVEFVTVLLIGRIEHRAQVYKSR